MPQQRKGIRYPDRIKTPGLRQAIDLLDQMSLEEQVVLRHAVTDRIARHAHYHESAELRDLGRRLKLMAAIETADFAKRQATGSGIVTIAEYQEWAADDAPGRSAIYRVFGSWAEARDEAGIAEKRVAQAELVRRDGRAAGREHPWTEPEFIRILARVLEEFRGYEPSERAYGLLRGDRPDWPSWQTFSGGQAGFGKNKDEWFDLAKRFILDRGPDAYPDAYRRLSMLARRAADGSGS